VEFGIFSNGARRNQIAADTYDADLQEVIVADRVGFTEAWVSEHLADRKIYEPDSLTVADLFLCKAAGLTEQIRLGPAIRVIAFHHPLQVAIDAATCDQLTRGRYMLGVGISGVESDHLAMRGYNLGDENFPTERIERTYEGMDYILKCWTGPTPFDFDGKYWQGRGIMAEPKPYQKPHVPVAIASGSHTGGLVDYAARMGFGFLTSQYDSPESIRRVADRYVAERVAAGYSDSREPIRACRNVYVSDSVRQARDELRDGFNSAMTYFSNRNSFKKILTPDVPADQKFDRLADAGQFIVGDPDTVCAEIKEFYDRSGGFGALLLVVGKDFTSPENVARSLELFSKYVAPRLAVLDPDSASRAN
jgi:limonene 1,2-monooxygenase